MSEEEKPEEGFEPEEEEIQEKRPGEDETQEEPQDERPERKARKSPTEKMIEKKEQQGLLGWIFGIIVMVAGACIIPIVHLKTGADWGSNTMLVAYIAAGVTISLVAATFVVLKVTRTRLSVEQEILQHREVSEYVILWDRPRWILYLPTMGLALLFGIILALKPDGFWVFTPRAMGGFWVGIAILNVLVEQFRLTIKMLLIIILAIATLFLLLRLVNYAGRLIKLFRWMAMDVPVKLYFTAAVVIALRIFLGWVYGLFHYIAITPNVADYQRGLTETGNQIQNQDYEVDFDATDVVERWLFGFGRIIISFKQSNRPPMVFFVPNAHTADDQIRRVRSVTAIDRHHDN